MEAHVTVNGQRRELGEVGGHVTLLEWLRAAGYTASKEGCAEGECGACAVLVAKPDGAQRTRWTAINACLVPAAGLCAQEVVTAEGLGTPDDLHPVQKEMADRGGSQCGYCTPGFICAMAGEYYRADRTMSTDGHDPEHGPNGFDLHALSGNLCRCTGYRPIKDAAYALGNPQDTDPLKARLERPAPVAGAATITSPHGTFVRPASLDQALQLLADQPDALLVAGSTDWGVELNIRHARAELTIGIDRLDELRALRVGEHSIEIGAALTLSEMERGLAGAVPLLDELVAQFASRLIRNGATLGGNLGTGSPIGDASPALMALDATVILTSLQGVREVSLAEYFTGYRETVMQPGELITSVRIPTPVAPLSAFHKIAKRRFDDISSVAIAFALRLRGEAGGTSIIDDITIGLGGVAATPMRATATETALRGRAWTSDVVAEAAEVMAGEGTPISDHRASSDYRAAMLGTALLKFFAENAESDSNALPGGRG